MPTGDQTRPTTDRTREALFSAIASWAGTSAGAADAALSGLGFCDLFAGSGAVGLEAASRGADPVVLVEADRRTADVAKANAADLGLRATVQAARAEHYVRTRAGRAFDVVFLDPPYDHTSEAVDALVAAIIGEGWVLPDGLVIVERSARTDPPTFPPGFDDGWDKRYGETVLYFAPGRTD